MRSASFDACHADPPRVVTAGRAFTTIFPPTSDVPCRSQAPSAATMRRELVVRAALAIAPDLRRWCYHHRLDRKTACATFGSSGSVAFRRRIRREPACQSRTCALAVKRLRSLDPERLPPYRPFRACTRKPRRPEFVIEHEDDAHTGSSLAFAAGRVRRLSTESID